MDKDTAGVDYLKQYRAARAAEEDEEAVRDLSAPPDVDPENVDFQALSDWWAILVGKCGM